MTGTWAATTTPSTISSGLAFTTNALAPSFPATWTTSPINDISILPDIMTAADLTSNPWLTRESTLTITGIAGTGVGPCGGTDQSQVITLNQTNYKIVPSTSTSSGTSSITPATLVVLRDDPPITRNLPIHSNVGWKATTEATIAQLGKVLSSADLTNATVKGGDKSDGTKYAPLTGTTGSKFDYQSVAVANAVKYETVDVTFVDANTPKRAPDAKVTFMQCMGTEDLSEVTMIADNTATSTTPAPAEWSGKVVKHEAKSDYYEEFYSAEFGAAGRWMTTNLAARKYDGIMHSTDDGTATDGQGIAPNYKRTLEGPYPNHPSGFDNAAYWCYPNSTLSRPSAWNSKQGLLYTWDAATAGKGGNSGRGNIYRLDANNKDFNDENSWPYLPGQLDGSVSTFPGNGGQGNYQWRIQGVCPAGWHLPSDREWTELENAIIKSTSTYAYMADISPDESVTLPLDVNNKSTSWRNAHGVAMKNICERFSNNATEGKSKLWADAGFNALLMGYAASGSIAAYGNDTYYWSSSSYNNLSAGAWRRTISYNRPGVERDSNMRSNLFSVRCKKD